METRVVKLEAELVMGAMRKSSEPLTRSDLKDQALSRLKAGILAGAIEPGEVYSVGAFAEQFGVSRTPVREALLELEARGLVELVPNVGFRVVPVSKREIRDMFEIREMLEIPAMGKVAGRLSPAAIDLAEELCENSRQAAARGDLAEFLENDREFHVHLVAQTGNRRLAEIVRELRDLQRMPGLRRMAETGSLTARGEDHREILDALVSGDAERAMTLIQGHLALSREAWAGE